MRIAIIGGRGMIGSSLAEECDAAGHEVTVLSRKIPGNPAEASGSIRLWDGRNSEILADLLQNMDAVVNLAGESIGKSRWTEQRKANLLTSRLEPAEALTAAIERMKNPPGVLIQASAVGYYGSGNEPVNEENPGGADFLAKLCAYWEEATLQIVHRIRRVVIRSGLVLNANQGILPQMALPFKLFVGGPLGSGRQWISWIHQQDEVRAIRFLLEHPHTTGIYNLTSPYPVTNADFGKTLAGVLHRPYWIPVPGLAIKTVLGEMSQLILEGQRVYPTRMQEAGFEFKYPSLEDALQDLYKS